MIYQKSGKNYVSADQQLSVDEEKLKKGSTVPHCSNA
jgi:hypothetical protein